MAKTVLIIDDEPGIRHMIQFELSGRGFSVLAAASGVEALNFLKKEKVDLVITDMRMPAMDGLDTVLAIRKTHPDLPIILMTGYMEDRVQRVLELKIAGFLQKPFTLDDLVRAVSAHFPVAPQ